MSFFPSFKEELHKFFLREFFFFVFCEQFMNSLREQNLRGVSSSSRGATAEITERLLQFIWQLQYFNKSELITTTGEKLQIISPGQFNRNQGPDFSDAKIRIGNTTWAGSIELHIKSSDWAKHKHDNDDHYGSVVLHVVCEDDCPGSNLIPLLELKERISKILLERYESFMNAAGFIPCERSIHLVGDITWQSWKERLLAERLTRKT